MLSIRANDSQLLVWSEQIICVWVFNIIAIDIFKKNWLNIPTKIRVQKSFNIEIMWSVYDLGGFSFICAKIFFVCLFVSYFACVPGVSKFSERFLHLFCTNCLLISSHFLLNAYNKYYNKNFVCFGFIFCFFFFFFWSNQQFNQNRESLTEKINNYLQIM